CAASDSTVLCNSARFLTPTRPLTAKTTRGPRTDRSILSIVVLRGSAHPGRFAIAAPVATTRKRWRGAVVASRLFGNFRSAGTTGVTGRPVTCLSTVRGGPPPVRVRGGDHVAARRER